MKLRTPVEYITINTMDGDAVGVRQSRLNDNIFIDTRKKANDRRCYVIKEGERKGEKVYICHRKRIKL